MRNPRSQPCEKIRPTVQPFIPMSSHRCAMHAFLKSGAHSWNFVLRGTVSQISWYRFCTFGDSILAHFCVPILGGNCIKTIGKSKISSPKLRAHFGRFRDTRSSETCEPPAQFGTDNSRGKNDGRAISCQSLGRINFRAGPLYAAVRVCILPKRGIAATGVPQDWSKFVENFWTFLNGIWVWATPKTKVRAWRFRSPKRANQNSQHARTRLHTVLGVLVICATHCSGRVG